MEFEAAELEKREAARITLDVVIPMFDEEAVLPALLEELSKTFSADAQTRHGILQVNCIFVDDGSQDSSVSIVRGSNPEGLGVRLLRLSRNFGHQAAVSAGVANSSADLVAVIDADLQDPPACILEMLAKWREGYEVVYGQRGSRREGLVKRFFYAAFYRFYRLLSPIHVPVDSGDFCLMSRRAVEELNRLPESVRFPRGLRAWIGFPQTAIVYDRPSRATGESRYGWRDLYHLATEGIASMSLRPLQLSQLLALVYLFLSFGGVTALLFNLFGGDLSTQLTFVIVLSLASNSIMLFCIYILGAYVGRTYWEAKGRPSYIVMDIVVVNEPSQGDRA